MGDQRNRHVVEGHQRPDHAVVARRAAQCRRPGRCGAAGCAGRRAILNIVVAVYYQISHGLCAARRPWRIRTAYSRRQSYRCRVREKTQFLDSNPDRAIVGRGQRVIELHAARRRKTTRSDRFVVSRRPSEPGIAHRRRRGARTEPDRRYILVRRYPSDQVGK